MQFKMFLQQLIHRLVFTSSAQ